ncbi:hypothetical protein RradSPS_1156 [Rubrobacter radiotolerans]|uniref:DUF72 domain-containing protein n=1 Tax=Rubrobacter radiotolerans TaxID=42256 RepID=A0A023X2Z3_RUBRA|nr:DUF72 domain-containing protein [Rubrobacter radiotolerans]AHY46439.1 hypothetical protein RradSPS_1156 [Rubrobacter radiotolerans]MDX5893846.1 DUF72 domain-containing protein [Rubrobacter radiotolerans]SMC04608.1 Uncharacterized conserved protein YecE, DUF72 family [Rubrobacter radiotolerans DSM 5868]
MSETGDLQERLFLEEPGRTEPPEPGLYLGTSGWSYADWEGSVYPEGLPAASRLSEYVKRYATVEVDSTFYGTPRRRTVERWREVAPAGFRFAAKFPREISHDRTLAGCRDLARDFVDTMSVLGEKLGPLLLQLPPYFDASEHETLALFLDALPQGVRYAVEVRHRSWLQTDLRRTLAERGVALTLVDYPGMPRLEAATADFLYVRWLGDRREFPEGHTHPRRDRSEDLAWWSKRIKEAISEGREVYAYANNHYQNHSPSTLAQFLEVYRNGTDA